MIILLVYTATVQPFELAFFDHDAEDHSLEISFEILFAIDMLINFVSAYVDRDRKLETRIKVIAANYIKSWFFLDLVAIMPFRLFETSPDHTGILDNGVNKLLRLARLQRL